MDVADTQRKIPVQTRAKASVDCILEAAAQLLEAHGEEGFNTNAVAVRAGVSIGTLYRYFPDKQSVLSALGRREMLAHHQATSVAARENGAGLSRDRALIRAFLQAFSGRHQARKIAMSAMLAEADHAALSENFEAVEAGLTMADGRPVSRVQAYVLSRAVHGAMRAAVLEGSAYLESPEFEDELVRLSRAYLGYTA